MVDRPKMRVYIKMHMPPAAHTSFSCNTEHVGMWDVIGWRIKEQMRLDILNIFFGILLSEKMKKL